MELNEFDSVDQKILEKYELVLKIGQGAYGVVWKAIDKITRKFVAIKKIFDAFENDTDAQRTLREVFIVKEMGSHPNIIQIENLRRASNNTDLYIVFELMDTDLHTIIRSQVCRDVQIRFISW